MEGTKTLSEEISDVVRSSVRDIIPEVVEQVRRAASEELQPKNQEGEFLLLVRSQVQVYTLQRSANNVAGTTRRNKTTQAKNTERILVGLIPTYCWCLTSVKQL